MSVKRIAIMASGSGSNAQKIMEYFADNNNVKVDCLLSNNPQAHALDRALKMGVETFTFDRNTFYNTTFVSDLLSKREVSLIVLAGFLWLVPEILVRSFKIINIHPALLPRYGGKNMYGMNVHRAVIESGDSVSGITIHHVNEVYDEGAVIFQAECHVDENDTPETLAEKIHQLEHTHYPRVIAGLLESNDGQN